MRNTVWRGAVLLSFSIFILSVAQIPAALAADEAGDPIQQAIDATVRVVMEFEGGMESTGTGFLLGDGFVLTNAHVVLGYEAGRVSIGNHLIPKTPVEVVSLKYNVSHPRGQFDPYIYLINRLLPHIDDIGFDPLGVEDEYDMALLRFDPDLHGEVRPLAFGRAPERMDKVVSVGYPGLTEQAAKSINNRGDKTGAPNRNTLATITVGTVASVIAGRPGVLMHTAPIFGGNSGGPLLNRNAEVVGMNTWSFSEETSNGVLFSAIAGDDLIAFLKELGVQPGGADAAGERILPEPEEKDYSAAVAKLTLQANQGNPFAMTILGILCHTGHYGVEPDSFRATQLLEAARVKQFPMRWASQYALGLLYVHSPDFQSNTFGLMAIKASNVTEIVPLNNPTIQDYDSHLLAHEAWLYYQGLGSGVMSDGIRSFLLANGSLAVNNRDCLAGSIVGFFAYFGENCAMDHPLAYRNAINAIQDFKPIGYALLAHLYYRNNGLFPPNDDLAFRLASLAAASDDPSAVALLADMHYEGRGVERDVDAAFGLAERSFWRGGRYAYFTIGKIYFDKFKESGDLEDAKHAWAFLDWARRMGVGVDESENSPKVVELESMIDPAGFAGFLYGARMVQAELMR